ncbi:Dyp-type peroxidase [Gordonia sp. TBRC 11910]|uniref:Dyp-type peroxidase n=1 Tax=Gordonia asplenii TaxID=2725283 RepID=A0A848KSK9_9ACTN|nr:Dyp-type peroxidase [Gordonia asplenii]NMO01666.1 Dyp-type peroxidase [Gordonia asplenii]
MTSGSATGQTIITRKTRNAVFLVLTVNNGGEAKVRDVLSGFTGLVRSVSSRAPDESLTGVAAIASDAWDRLFGGPRPKDLKPFRELVGSSHTAPATPGDILLHIKADDDAVCFELAAQAVREFGDAVSVADDVHGFRYFEMRDLTGFVDGTENPAGSQALDTITVDDDPDFDGGSYVTVQRYVTDFGKWNSLSTTEQEIVFGRTKADNIEFPDEDKAPNAHIAVNQVNDADGNQLQILRDNMAWGSPSGERGTYYIAYCGDPDVTEQMLVKMFVGDPVGNYDRLLDFTTAVTGTSFFAPSADFLDNPPAPSVAAVEDSAVPAPPDRPADGSLGIGSLR